MAGAKEGGKNAGIWGPEPGMLEPEVRAGGAIGAGKDLACGGFGERREVLGV